MKNMKNFASRLVAFGTAFVVMAWVSAASAQAGNQGAAKVVRLKGAARYTIDNVNWLPLKVGDTVKPGAVIQTASSSQVDLVLSGREAVEPQPMAGKPALRNMVYRPEGEARANMVRLYENTVLGVDKLAWMETGADLVTETQLDLRAGKIFGTVKKLSIASKYEVKLPNGVAGIRGTIYTISASGVVSVLSGSVVMAWVNADGTVVTQVVNAGETFDPATGLVTPIPSFNQTEMIDAARMSGTAIETPTRYVVDETIYYVSPIEGGSAPPSPPPSGPGPE